MTPARLQWGAALGDAPRRFWRRSAAVARRLPQTAAHNDEREARRGTDPCVGLDPALPGRFALPARVSHPQFRALLWWPTTPSKNAAAAGL